jgi:N-acetylglucosamine kinase-like BadF-type ATPase
MMADEPLLLAVDGGQTSTLALVATTDGTIIGSGRGGPSNHINEPGWRARLETALHDCLDSAIESAGATWADIGFVCMGISGATGITFDVAREIVPAACPLEVHKDIITALAGASRLAASGVIVIAGTGGVAYGKLADGRNALSDGWGYIMGDEGGAYSIGIAALRAAARAHDQRGVDTVLLPLILQRFAKPILREVRIAIHAGEIERPQIAALAAMVTGAAQDGDAVSAQILADAGRGLALGALGVLRQLEQVERGMAIYYTGGVFRAGDFVLQTLESTLKAESPNSTLQPAEFNPIVGGLFMVLKLAGVELNDDIVATIRRTLPPDAIEKFITPL